MKVNYCTLRGICKECGSKVEREYSINVVKGLELCSDDYKLHMPCDCEGDKYGGNVLKRDVRITEILRDNKIKQILD